MHSPDNSRSSEHVPSKFFGRFSEGNSSMLSDRQDPRPIRRLFCGEAAAFVIHHFLATPTSTNFDPPLRSS